MTSNIITWLTPSATCGCFLFVIRREGSLQIHHQDMKTYKPEEEWFGAVGFNNHIFIFGHKCSFKKTFGARIKKLAFICFWKTRLWSDLSVSVARCHIQRSRRRRTESVAEFQYLFDVTWYVPACWWRQNQDFIEKPGSFPHSNQVVFVS